MQNNDNASIICSNHVMLFCVYCSILIGELLYQLGNWYLIPKSIFVLTLSAIICNQTKKAFIFRVSTCVCLSVYLTLSTSLCSPACPCMMLAHYRPQHFIYIPYPEPVYTGWSSVHWNATRMPLVDPVYTGIPLGHQANTCRVHWNITGKTHWDASGETLTFATYTGTPLEGLWQPTHALTHIVKHAE